jgi:hypothetical protein
MDYVSYMDKRSEQRLLKGLNLEIQWAKREIRRARYDVAKQASLQFYRHVLAMKARRCHWRLAFLNGTSAEHVERTTRKPAPSFETGSDMHSWINGPTMTEEYSSYAMTG